MAHRPVFIPSNSIKTPVITENVAFEWHSGLSYAQKQKSISSLHEKTKNTLSVKKILEVSSKSQEKIGASLSAFNLPSNIHELNCKTSVENVFQASKIFDFGGPFLDLLYVSAREAKKDTRLQNSGKLRNFSLNGDIWPIEPQTLFYDWIYLKALSCQPLLRDCVMNYDAFTDIEFNPKKSINCQAYSVALFVSLYQMGILFEVISHPDKFIDFMKKININNARQNDNIQPTLF